MITIIDTNKEKNSIGLNEFVKPLENIIGKCHVIHYSDMDEKINLISESSHVIISGCPMKDVKYIKDIRDLCWYANNRTYFWI